MVAVGRRSGLWDSVSDVVYRRSELRGPCCDPRSCVQLVYNWHRAVPLLSKENKYLSNQLTTSHKLYHSSISHALVFSQLLWLSDDHTGIKMTNPQRYPVAIIGGGPVGLSSSILLYLRNIPHVLFERHHGTSIHPKACGLNQRTGEIFRQMGVEQAIIAQGAPPDTCSKTACFTSLGPTGTKIVSRDA